MLSISQALNNIHSSESFDVIVVIIFINIRHLDKRCTLIVSDDSLQCHETARILLSNLHQADLEKLIHLQKRDIVRFNTLFVHKHYKVGRDNTTNGNHIQMSTIVCDLNHKRISDEYSLSFSKVGTSTDIAGGTVLFETNVPFNLRTPKEKIMSIGNFFHSNHGREMIMKDTAPCEDRKVREVRFPYLLSNVIVRVSQIEVDESSSKWSRMKKFQTRMILTDGLGIQDDEDSIPLIVDCNSLLSNDLRQAFRQQTTVVLRSVLTKKRENDRWSHNSEYYLVSTPSTRVEEYVLTSKRARIGSCESSCTTNLTLNCLQSASFNHSQSHDKISVVGCITLIEIKHTSTRLEKDGDWPELLKLHQCLVSESTFLPAIITITLQGTFSTLQVEAPGNIMNTLCGSFAVKAASKTRNIENISKLLRGFMIYDIPLEWIIQESIRTGVDIPIVEEVNLLSMDF
jgi:hypothetical protein